MNAGMSEYPLLPVFFGVYSQSLFSDIFRQKHPAFHREIPPRPQHLRLPPSLRSLSCEVALISETLRNSTIYSDRPMKKMAMSFHRLNSSHANVAVCATSQGADFSTQEAESSGLPNWARAPRTMDGLFRGKSAQRWMN